jgi:hypothetical protein
MECDLDVELCLFLRAHIWFPFSQHPVFGRGIYMYVQSFLGTIYLPPGEVDKSISNI